MKIKEFREAVLRGCGKTKEIHGHYIEDGSACFIGAAWIGMGNEELSITQAKSSGNLYSILAIEFEIDADRFMKAECHYEHWCTEYKEWQGDYEICRGSLDAYNHCRNNHRLSREEVLDKFFPAVEEKVEEEVGELVGV